MTQMFRYFLRIIRMVDLFARGRINFTNLMLSLLPSQVAVLARKDGMLFCDRETERTAFGE